MKAAKAIPELTEKDKARFWAKVNQSGPTQPHMDSPCWEWTGAIDVGGYGKIWIETGTFLAHRVAFVLAGGILDSKNPHACHRCDHPPCCNPSHLFGANHAENHADKEAKGRGNQPRGENVGLAKLTSEKVTEIRARYAAGGISQPKLGREYGVHHTLIGFIVRRKIWRHVA